MTERTSVVSNLIREDADKNSSGLTRPCTDEKGSGCEKPEASRAGPRQAWLFEDSRGPTWSTLAASRSKPIRHSPHINTGSPACAGWCGDMRDSSEARESKLNATPEQEKLRRNKELPTSVVASTRMVKPSRLMPQIDAGKAAFARLCEEGNKPIVANPNTNAAEASQASDRNGTARPGRQQSRTEN